MFRKANSAVVVSLRSRNGEALKVAGKIAGRRARQRLRRNAAPLRQEYSRRDYRPARRAQRLAQTGFARNSLEGLLTGLEIKP